jgi:hypothetical protein
MARSWSASRSRRLTAWPRALALMASAVPQAPAPITVICIASATCAPPMQEANPLIG